MTFENDTSANTGMVSVTAGWVPKHQRLEPTARAIIVAPKAAATIELEVPDFEDVRRLSITVSLDAGETGLLDHSL